MRAPGLTAKSPTALLFVGVFCFVFADTLQQTILPLSLAAAGASVTLIGIAIAVPQGIGFVTSLPAVAFGDRYGRRVITLIGASIAAVAMFVLAFTSGSPAFVWWMIPIIAFGLTRLVVWIAVLATVSTTNDPFRMQGINGATQRGAAAAAAIVAGVIIATEVWALGFVLVAAGLAAVIPVALRALPTRPVPADDTLPSPARAYGVAIKLASTRLTILASAFVALCCLVVMMVGTSFFGLTLTRSLDPGEIAVIVVTLLLTRDLASIVFGLVFHRLILGVGLPGAIMCAAGCATAGLALLSFAGTSLVVLVLAAVLQGAAVAWCIGTTNILAVGIGPQSRSGAGLRIAASNIIPCIGALCLPLAFAATLQFGGSELLFAVASAIALILGVAAFLLSRIALRPIADAQAPLASRDSGLYQQEDHT